ncbi:hypothetical protein CL652_02955 [bacterium]|nr:hypothetical protein [bacterium]|tara:strand:- start:21151 stop:21660 length:510 start_codon:yes stop_codon:yes gene_type:complete
MVKTIFSFIGGFAVGFLIVWSWNAYTDRPALDVPAEATAPANLIVQESKAPDAIVSGNIESTAESTNIEVRDQIAGERVAVASATLSSDGWIVIHEENNGLIGNALGAVRRNAGTYQNIEVPLLRSTIANLRYWVVLYSDNGDKQFSLRDDFPLRDNAEYPITRSFLVQ